MPRNTSIMWNYQTDHLRRAAQSFLEEKILCDVTLASQGQFFEAHQFVLAAFSPYFKDMFKRLSGQKHPVIVLDNISCQEVKAILDYMYKGEAIVADSKIYHFLNYCKNLKIEGFQSDNEASDSDKPAQEEQQHKNANQRKSAQNDTEDTTRPPVEVAATEGTSVDNTLSCLNASQPEAPLPNVMRSPPYTEESFNFILDLPETNENESSVLINSPPDNIIEISDTENSQELEKIRKKILKNTNNLKVKLKAINTEEKLKDNNNCEKSLGEAAKKAQTSKDKHKENLGQPAKEVDKNNDNQEEILCLNFDDSDDDSEIMLEDRLAKITSSQKEKRALLKALNIRSVDTSVCLNYNKDGNRALRKRRIPSRFSDLGECSNPKSASVISNNTRSRTKD